MYLKAGWKASFCQCQHWDILGADCDHIEPYSAPLPFQRQLISCLSGSGSPAAWVLPRLRSSQSQRGVGGMNKHLPAKSPKVVLYLDTDKCAMCLLRGLSLHWLCPTYRSPESCAGGQKSRWGGRFPHLTKPLVITDITDASMDYFSTLNCYFQFDLILTCTV